MKKHHFLMCMGMLCLPGLQSYAQNLTFKINGRLENISPMPTKIYLNSLVNGLLKKDKDSVMVKNGRYTFSGELHIDEAAVVSLSSDSKDLATNSFSLYLDKGELNLVSTGNIKSTVVTGTGAKAQQEHDAIIKGVENERQELKRIVTTNEYKTNRELQANVLKRSRALGAKGLYDMYSFAKNNPGSRSAPITSYAIILSNMISAQGQDTLMQNLPARVKADKLGLAIAQIQVKRDSMLKAAIAAKKEEAGKIAVGSQAPDFTQNDVNNTPVKLSSFKGKYVLVDFWASWCMPCRAENPNVVKAYNKYKDKGFTILGVSLDAQSARAAWLKAIANDGLVWTQVSDLKGWKNEAAAIYGVGSVPQNFLIDPNGKVVAKNLRGSDLDSTLASILK